jgi:hypothetical protein
MIVVWVFSNYHLFLLLKNTENQEHVCYELGSEGCLGSAKNRIAPVLFEVVAG